MMDGATDQYHQITGNFVVHISPASKTQHLKYYATDVLAEYIQGSTLCRPGKQSSFMTMVKALYYKPEGRAFETRW
jgi:hypothetical protein